MEITISIWTLITWGLILVVVSYLAGNWMAMLRHVPDDWGDDA